MKKIFLLTVLCLLAVLNVEAQEAYARFNSDNGTLTFYYDNNKASGDYSMNNVEQVPAWSAVKGSVLYVEFAESFASYRPTATNYWFQGMSELKGIRYLSNLNTEEVTSMGYMFDGCKKLGRGSFALVLSSFKTDKVTNMQSMFKDCAMLPHIDVNSFNTSKVQQQVLAGSEGMEGGPGGAPTHASTPEDNQESW